jgi:serine/threonine protein kinase
MMAANPQYAEGEVIANKYVVEGLIGDSPSARSYLANGNAGKLCVKIYRPEVSARLLSAPDFFLKAGVMTEIEHDNLCACVDVQEEMGLVFIARAHSEGLSFEDWIRKHRGDGNYFSRGMELLWQTCQGLTAIHERTRHLNIHPGNIIVGPLVAKLCDWDPRALGNTEMTPDPMPGRPEYQGYRAPEAAGRNGFLSYPSTDLFAVAGVLYRLVKGEHPSVNPAQTLSEVRSMDKDLAAFLSKALSPRLEDRFQDASAFSDGLWELSGAMQRLQERSPRQAAAPAQPAPRREEPMFPDPPAPAVQRNEPDFSASPKETKPEDDSFFNFFPAADAGPAAPQGQGTHHNPAHNPVQPAEPNSSSGTLFGAPAFVSPRSEPAKPARVEPPYVPPHNPPYVPPRQEPRYEAPPQPQSGMSGLETPGTLFGGQQPLFSSQAKPARREEPPAPPKPAPISLSSLEKDPLEMAGNDQAGGFTAYGFKGAGDSNRTGIYTPEAKAAAAKTKLMILLGTVGALILVVGLVGLFLYLRSHAAHKDEVADAQSTSQPESDAIPEPAADIGTPDQAVAVQTPPTVRRDPEPARVDPDPVAPPNPPQPTPEPVAASPGNGYSEPPMPVEPPRPGAVPDKGSSQPTAQTPPKPAVQPIYKGNNHVSAEREAALMAMVQTRVWPNSPGERLKAADELNDLGKTAEANMAYSKALAAQGINEKQKISAFGGLAVTFQSMGMRDQARDAVEQILALNPKNGFALKLKSKLQ